MALPRSLEINYLSVTHNINLNPLKDNKLPDN
jgi:hypothetical protein